MVARREVDLDTRLVGYVVVDPEGARNEEGALVSQWESLYDDTYTAPDPEDAAESTAVLPHDFNIIGWNSSYTGDAIPAAEMREWVDETVAPVLAGRPERVLEIGCGTGLLLYRIAPHTRRYLATDFSRSAIEVIGRHLDDGLQDRVELRRAAADELTDLEPAAFDAVILNSVIQYFPSVSYLLGTLERAVAATADGGRVHIGDVRNLRLLEAHHASVQLFQASDSQELDELRARVRQRLAQEEELVVDPVFFMALREHLPRVTQVEIRPKRGHADNELTRFRYQVTLHVGVPEQERTAAAPAWRDWADVTGAYAGEATGTAAAASAGTRHGTRHGTGHVTVSRAQVTTSAGPDARLERLAAWLAEHQPEVLGLRDIPNRRTGEACAAAASLLGSEHGGTVSNLRSELQAQAQGVDIGELCALVDGRPELPYRVAMSWAMPSEDGRFDAALVRTDGAPRTAAQLATLFPQPPLPRKPWESYGNHPLQAKMTQQLAPRLREDLERTLPSYMVPSAFVMLESLPLTANGKVDRKALPDPDWFLSQRQGAYQELQTESQRRLGAIWRELLGVEQVGLEDDFFDLGGHSLLATQVVSRIRDDFGVELSLRQLFETPTVAELAEAVDALGWNDSGDGEGDGIGGSRDVGDLDGDRETGEL